MSSALVWSTLGIYIAVGIGVAVWSRLGRGTADMSGYFLGQRRMSGFVSALSYSATTYSAFMMVGLAGLTYIGGIGALGFEIIYFSGVSLVAIFGPQFWRVGREFGFVTPSEMLGYRYGNRGVAVAVALTSCLFLIPYAAVQLAGIGYLMAGATDGAISFSTGVILATVLAIVFSNVAGIRSVMWTDSLQAIVMMITSVLATAWVIHSLGGLDTLFTTLAQQQPQALVVPGDGFFSFVTFLGLTIPWFFFSLSNPQVSQRLYMPASMVAMRRMILGFLAFGFVYTLISVLWGFSARIALPGLDSADLATPELLASIHIPAFVGVIVIVAIMAAAVSTIDSILITLSSMLSRDVYAHMRSDATEARQLVVGKVVIPIIALLALGFAGLQLNLIAVLSVAASSGLVVVVPAIIGAFYWRRGAAAGALVSIVGGGLFVLFVYAVGGSLWGVPAGILGLPVAIVLFVVGSLLTRPSLVADHFMTVASAGRRNARAPDMAISHVPD